MWEKEINDYRFGRFLGGFISEGNLVDTGSLKITNQNLQFIDCIVKSATSLFGATVATSKPPTLDHVNNPDAFAYHKYLSKKFGKFLIEEIGIKPGKRVLNNESLPKFILEWSESNQNLEEFKFWMKNYFQARFSGDGWVHLEKRWIGLTKANAIHTNSYMKGEISKLYRNGKGIKEYPKFLIDTLKKESRKQNNLPRELLELKSFLAKLFSIESRVYPVGIKTIYRDKKRDILIISATYHLIISKENNIRKFRDEINFLEVDKINRKRLNVIFKSLIAGRRFELLTSGL